jgi:hypothetical protein
VSSRIQINLARESMCKVKVIANQPKFFSFLDSLQSTSFLLSEIQHPEWQLLQSFGVAVSQVFTFAN